MKVVILHDWLTGFRGGERVLEALCEMYPDAPIYTLIHVKGSTCPIIESREIHTSILNKIPGIERHYKKFLPVMPWVVSTMKLPEDADLVISSSHCVIKGVKKPKGSKHICYIHSPMRYMYDQFKNYFDGAPLYIKFFANLFRPYLVWWDKNSNDNVDSFVSNSAFVKARVSKHYDRSATIIHPFVDLWDIKNAKLAEQKDDFFLMVSAFAPNKRLDIAINAFNGTDKKLKIIGKASKKEIEHYQGMVEGNNIEFMGDLSREEVLDHFRRAQAFIFPGVEDFGITPIESMACGTPVIAYRAGGVLETVTDETGLFFEDPTPESLREAVNKFSLKNFQSEEIRVRGEKFSKERFVKEIKNHFLIVSRT